MPYETEEQFLKRLQFNFSDIENQKIFLPKALQFQWHITDQCNLRCKHCYQNDYNADKDLSIVQLLNILDQYLILLNTWKIRGHINITGGEPLLSKHLFNLLEKISSNKHLCGFAILSNGIFVDDSIAKDLKKLGCSFFQISVEGGQTIHDQIRGEDNFEKCIKAIEILRKNKIQTMVSFTSSKLNSENFDEVVKFCRKNKVDVLWTDRYLPMGNGIRMQDELMQPLEFKKFLERVFKFHHKLNSKWFHKTELRMHRALNFLITEEHNCDCYAPYKCAAGRSLITVLSNGDLAPCRRMPIVVGNLLKDKLENLYKSSILFNILRNNNIPFTGCKACDKWNSCNGGLRCLSYAYYGNPFITDPQCFKTFSVLPEIN